MWRLTSSESPMFESEQGQHVFRATASLLFASSPSASFFLLPSLALIIAQTAFAQVASSSLLSRVLVQPLPSLHSAYFVSFRLVSSVLPLALPVVAPLFFRTRCHSSRTLLVTIYLSLCLTSSPRIMLSLSPPLTPIHSFFLRLSSAIPAYNINCFSSSIMSVSF